MRQVAAGGTITTLAGTGVAGRLEPLGGPAANALLNGPAGVTTDSSGNVIIADAYNNRIVEVNAAHQLLAVAGTAGTSRGKCGWRAAAVAAGAVWPQAVCTGLGASLYIADTGQSPGDKLPSGGVLQTVAGNGSVGYAGDGGPARWPSWIHPAPAPPIPPATSLSPTPPTTPSAK